MNIDDSVSNARRLSGISYQQQDAVNAKPASGLCAAIQSANHNNLRASDVLGRLRSIADTVGGSHPTGEAKAERNPPPMGYLGQIYEAHGVMSSVLAQIEEEVVRLEGLVG